MADGHNTPDAQDAAFEKAVTFIMSRVRAQPRAYTERTDLGLRPIERLLERLGNPHRAFECLHIAGSKGKGSVALYVEAVLRAAGFRTGTYTSPHLRDWTERIRIDGANSTREVFAAAVEATAPQVHALDELDAETAPGFFDVLTAAAFVAFRDAGIEVAVLETGLGGRLDATNAVAPVATCITSIELEHTDKLGNTLGAIAGEKAGIIKPGVPLVTGLLPAEAEAVIDQRARELAAPRCRYGEELAFEITAWHDDALQARIGIGSFDAELKLPTLGEALARNAGLALALVHASALCGDTKLGKASLQLEHTPLPGRIEIVERRPWIVLDGAHTKASVDALKLALDRVPADERRAIVSVSRDRNAPALLAPVLETATTLIAIAPDPDRSMPANALAQTLRDAYPSARVEQADDVAGALASARDGLGPQGLIVVTGSVYAAGGARRILVPNP